MEKVKFVRIKGRIVPIRNSKKVSGKEKARRTKKAQGVALVSAGGIFAASGATVAGLFSRKSKQLRKDFASKLKKTPVQLDMFRSPKFKHGTSQTRRIAARRAIVSKSVFNKTSLLTSALVAIGTTKLVNNFSKNKSTSESNQIKAELLGVGAFAATSSIQRGVFNKVSKGSSLRKSFAKDFSDLAKKVKVKKVYKAFKVFF